MCGICGFLEAPSPAPRPPGHPEARQVARRMARSLVHRGPDAEGLWTDPDRGVALASRRLKILDLTPAGDQPMRSPCGRFVVVHNGEIYNFPALREELEGAGFSFRGGSDTEVVAAALTRWGVGGAVARLEGMFALAIWDRETRCLELLRDRLGQKPLYYGRVAGHGDGWTVLFASELRAFHHHPAFVPEIERRALPLLLRRGCVLDPWTIYRGVWKLPPGARLSVEADRLARGEIAPPERYWSAARALERGAQSPFAGSFEEGVDALEQRLGEAVAGCLLSDVPLGALLSGGVDSSTVVGMMVDRAPGQVKTFTIGFDRERFDEAHHAARVASHLGCDHTELYLSEDDALAVVPELARLYDEPFADPSQIPTYLVSALARRHVTVALTGDGGDELFGGYPKYRQLATVLRIARWPQPLRRAAIGLARRLPLPVAPRLERLGAAGRRAAGWQLRESADKLAALFAATEGAAAPDDAAITWIAALWRDPATAVRDADEPATALTDPSSWPDLGDPVRRAMALDVLTFLPSDILVKVDRAAMAVSLETRVPLLERRVFELAASFPRPWVTGKAVLRHLLYRRVPRELVERPKMGFEVPLDAWLRGPLRDWADDLLAADRLEREGWFEPQAIVDLWTEHRRGQGDRGAHLWPVLMFQAWLDGGGAAAAGRAFAAAGGEAPARRVAAG